MKLSEARKQAQKTQQQVAGEAGMSLPGYRKLESGKVRVPQLSTALNVARALEVRAEDVDELLPAVDGEEVAGQLTTANFPSETKAYLDTWKAWRDLTRAFVRTGYAEELMRDFRQIQEEVGDEGRRYRTKAEEEARRINSEENELRRPKEEGG